VGSNLGLPQAPRGPRLSLVSHGPSSATFGRVLVTRPLPGGTSSLSEAGCEVVSRDNSPFGHDEIVALVPDVDAIICTLSDRIDNAVLTVGDRLKVVANVAVGYDNIDVDTASKVGVLICNTPGVLDDAVGDLTFLLMLGAARLGHQAATDLRSGNWRGWGIEQYLGLDLQGSSLGLVGFGGTAQAVARRATAFGMTVKHFTRRDTGHPGWRSRLDQLLDESSFVSLHVPLTTETRHLIDLRELRRIGPAGVLINTSRGPIVNEEALAIALEEGYIFGAGIDVYENEPLVHPRLLKSPRAFLLPHIGSATITTRSKMAAIACTSALGALRGQRPSTALNEPLAPRNGSTMSSPLASG
jgi:glyoxylate reductase